MRIAWFLLVLLHANAFAQAPLHTVHPKQGLIDLLMEYMQVRYPDHAVDGDLLYISVHRQTLFHVRNGALLTEYPIATASNGLGAEQDSYRTPTGLHRITEKVGDGVPPLGILKDRTFTGELADPDFAGVDKDWITSRILWLSGLEPGTNQGGAVDSHDRYIYIHGTANERSVGTPSSKGCIRMRNADVITLYDQVPVNALVVVLDN
jgi:hypothetical protein